MHCEIVMVGSELLLGQIVDTNATFMASALAENGIALYLKTTVGDNAQRIKAALDGALARSGVVLVSGGLGPTEDDITRECVAELLGRPLEFRPDLYETLAALFKRYRFTMSENNKKQAYVPRGATPIENPRGTAPGLIVEDERGTIICMPGVPGELKFMLTEKVIPYLREKFGIAGIIHSRVLKVCGLGESRVDAAIGDIIKSRENPTVGVLASPDAVRIRITARAANRDEAEALIDSVDAEVRERLPGLILGINETTLEEVVGALLDDRGWKMAIAETTSGGMLARLMTSANTKAFAGALVLPHSEWDTTDRASAAARIAEKARQHYAVDCALGLMGAPTGLSNGARTAIHFICPERHIDWKLGFGGTDERSQIRTSIVALEYLRRWLTGVSQT